MSEAKTEWFIEADEATNRIIAEQVPDAEECPGIICGDGQARNLWRVPAHQVAMLAGNRRKLGLNFTVFCRVDTRGIHVSFLFNSPQKRSAWKRVVMAA
ncbi:MAG: hypothetical protein WC250_01425 [Candidatus Paceibacterota bacterium]